MDYLIELLSDKVFDNVSLSETSGEEIQLTCRHEDLFLIVKILKASKVSFMSIDIKEEKVDILVQL